MQEISSGRIWGLDTAGGTHSSEAVISAKRNETNKRNPSISLTGEAKEPVVLEEKETGPGNLTCSFKYRMLIRRASLFSGPNRPE